MQNVSTANIRKQLISVYGENIMSHQMVAERRKQFLKERNKVQSQPCLGRLQNGLTSDGMASVCTFSSTWSITYFDTLMQVKNAIQLRDENCSIKKLSRFMVMLVCIEHS